MSDKRKHLERALAIDHELEVRGYRRYESSSFGAGVECLWQKSVRMLGPTGQGKRFIDIYKWDWDLLPHYTAKMLPIGYEVGATFEVMTGDWVTFKFYTLTPETLMDRLGDLENKIALLFDLLEGVPQE